MSDSQIITIHSEQMFALRPSGTIRLPNPLAFTRAEMQDFDLSPYPAGTDFEPIVRQRRVDTETGSASTIFLYGTLADHSL